MFRAFLSIAIVLLSACPRRSGAPGDAATAGPTVFRCEAAGCPDADAKAELGMHFDLTVPFSRYVLEHAGRLEFPFRRYQIQPAWRGERPQEGRYRQFTQADIDIVGRDTLGFHHDVEVVRVMVEAPTIDEAREVAAGLSAVVAAP